jgi:hypothetical protein
VRRLCTGWDAGQGGKLVHEMRLRVLRESALAALVVSRRNAADGQDDGMHRRVVKR